MKQLKRNGIGSRGVTRREVLRLGAVGAASAALGPLVVTPARAQAFNWRRFAGQRIFVLLMHNPWGDTMMNMAPDFEKQTGIKVEFWDLPEMQARQKLVVELAAGAGGIDAWWSNLYMERRRFWKSGWTAPLNKFLNDPTMTAPDYDWNDMTNAAKQAVTLPDGSITGLPAFVDPHILFYRKDLFQQKGLNPPRTLAEMEEIAQKFHDPPKMYGFVARGLKNANATQWCWVLFSMGGDFLTKDRKASINTPEAIKAMDWYAGMLRRFAPPGVVNFNWYECSAAFMQGQVALYYDGVNFATQFEEKEKSKVAGKVGYAVLPAGPGGHFAPTYSNAIAVGAQSKNQGPAYFFAQWSTSKESAIKELLAGQGSARVSPWNDPEVKTKGKMPPDWTQAYVDSLKIGRTGIPDVVGAIEYRDIIGVAIQKAIEGAKSEEVLAQAQKEFQEMLDRTE